ncbi:N-substituted formamide deformylase [bacterium HR33]|nr:N-substituted formamide deformylase [bacterium HR33]
MISILAAVAVCALQAGAPQVESQQRTLVLVNARFWTAAATVPWVEAVAIRGEWIVAAGSRQEVLRAAGGGAVVEDLQGRMVVPGFIDTHTHFNRAGELLLGVNLLDVADDDGFRRKVGEAHARLPDGSWMVGGDWGAYALGSSWVPSRRLLDSLVGDRPALLNRWDRSIYLASAAALRAAGIDPSSHSGQVSGVELERVRAAIPRPSFEQRLAEARLALADLARHGVTTIHDNTPAEAMRLFQYLKERDSLSVRVCARPTLDRVEQLAALGIETGFGDSWLRICGLKGFVDGIMGNSTARFREPYRHRPESRGQWRAMMEPPGNMERLLRLADSAGLTPQVHAIGDLAVDTLLDFFEQLIEERPAPRRQRRFRVIHAQVVEPDDFARFGSLGIVAEVQPYHAIDDMRWMEERIGERARWAYAFRSLKRGGALLVFGSDWPGTNASWYPADPILGIYAAVTRQTLEGEPAGGWFPEERLTVQEALEAYTKDAAWAAYEESWKGRLLPGFVADLAVLSENLFEIQPSRIKEVRVVRTMVGGRWVYRAEP